ncbi:hypothetical protein GCM10027575_79750 [Phytohabitans suffuscus]
MPSRTAVWSSARIPRVIGRERLRQILRRAAPGHRSWYVTAPQRGGSIPRSTETDPSLHIGSDRPAEARRSLWTDANPDPGRSLGEIRWPGGTAATKIAA